VAVPETPGEVRCGWASNMFTLLFVTARLTGPACDGMDRVVENLITEFACNVLIYTALLVIRIPLSSAVSAAVQRLDVTSSVAASAPALGAILQRSDTHHDQTTREHSLWTQTPARPLPRRVSPVVGRGCPPAISNLPERPISQHHLHPLRPRRFVGMERLLLPIPLELRQLGPDQPWQRRVLALD
jgi:hypothetical protein